MIERKIYSLVRREAPRRILATLVYGDGKHVCLDIDLRVEGGLEFMAGFRDYLGDLAHPADGPHVRSATDEEVRP